MKVKFNDSNLWKTFLAVLGTIGTFTGFITIFVTIPENYKLYAGIIFTIVIFLLFIGLWILANRLNKISLTINRLTVNIIYGDIFNQSGLKTIPFNEYFDTQVDNIIIAKNSLNGKLINSKYPSTESLDQKIETSLKTKELSTNHSRTLGKKIRYELGTCIEVDNEYVLTAFTKFDNENRAYLSKGDYLTCLLNIWSEINKIYAQRDVNIPLLGSGISRIGNEMKMQDYLEQMLNTLKLSNIDSAQNTSINIVLHESVKKDINLFEIKSKYI